MEQTALAEVVIKRRTRRTGLCVWQVNCPHKKSVFVALFTDSVILCGQRQQ